MKFWEFRLERSNLLTVAASNVHESDLFGRREAGGHFRAKVDGVEPGRQTSELCLHEPVESALLDGVRLQPGVKVDGGVLPDFEGVELLRRVGENGVESAKGGQAVVMAAPC